MPTHESHNSFEPSFDPHSEQVQELREILNGKLMQSPEGFDKLEAIQESLRGKYTEEELKKYKLWHLIIGSSPLHEHSPEFDLPNGEIEKFIREEL